MAVCSSRIVCIRVQWNHSDLSGSDPRVVLAGRVLGCRDRCSYLSLQSQWIRVEL